MLKRLTQLPTGIDGFEAIGEVSKEDCDQALEPAFEDARRDGRRVRLLCELGPRFSKFMADATWAQAKLGPRSIRMLERGAVVTDLVRVSDAVRLAAYVMPCPIRLFGSDQRAMAIDWLRALPAAPAVSHRLIPNTGVMVVEVHAPVEAHDFDSLAAATEEWVESHGALDGFVIRAGQLPRWENLLRHLRPVRHHHRRVERVALAMDERQRATLPDLAPHFVNAEILSFGYEAIDRAITWAGERRAGRTAPELTEAHLGRLA